MLLSTFTHSCARAVLVCFGLAAITLAAGCDQASHDQPTSDEVNATATNPTAATGTVSLALSSETFADSYQLVITATNEGVVVLDSLLDANASGGTALQTNVPGDRPYLIELTAFEAGVAIGSAQAEVFIAAGQSTSVSLVVSLDANQVGFGNASIQVEKSNAPQFESVTVSSEPGGAEVTTYVTDADGDELRVFVAGSGTDGVIEAQDGPVVLKAGTGSNPLVTALVSTDIHGGSNAAFLVATGDVAEPWGSYQLSVGEAPCVGANCAKKGCIATCYEVYKDCVGDCVDSDGDADWLCVAQCAADLAACIADCVNEAN